MSQVTEQEVGSLLSTISRIEDADQMRRVREALTHRQIAIGQTAIRKIRVGNKVKWVGKLGAQDGTVLKIKQKYVEVRASAAPGTIGMVWNVPASMLTVVV